MRRLSLSTLWVAVLSAASASSAWAQAEEANTSEIQERARQVILTRAIPMMEQSARAADLSPEQASRIELLLQEQRRTISLFSNFSGLSGEALQDKLLEVLDVTRSQLRAGRSGDVP